MSIPLRLRVFFNNSLPLLFCLVIFCLVFSPVPVHADQAPSTVLVSSKSSTVKKISRKELRRIYLGVRPRSKTNINSPVLNTSNPLVYNQFLKNILFLTESGYKRKLIKRVFRQGADDISRFESLNALITHLKQHPNDISFMTADDAKNHPELKIIQALW